MSLISPASLASLAGISTRQLQRMARDGDVPRAERTAGGHWQIPDTKELRDWAEAVRKRIAASRIPRRKGGRRWIKDVGRAGQSLRELRALLARPETQDYERKAAYDTVATFVEELQRDWSLQNKPPQPSFTEDWRAVRDAERVISNWHKNRWGKPAPNNHIRPEHFREVMRRMEEIAADVLGGGD